MGQCKCCDQHVYRHVLAVSRDFSKKLSVHIFGINLPFALVSKRETPLPFNFRIMHYEMKLFIIVAGLLTDADYADARDWDEGFG